VLVNGRDITGVAPHKICGMGLGRSFQRTNIFPKLTVLENVRAALLAHRGQGPNFWSRANRLCHSEAEALLASVGLAEQARATARKSSSTLACRSCKRVL
jgi:branched-chain amino acid transport system ATP-binding protein